MRWDSISMMGEAARAAVLEGHRARGVRIPCGDGVVIAPDVRIGEGTLVLPGTLLLNGCVIGRGCVLNNVQAEGAVVGDGCEIGPWVRLRPGTVLGGGVRVGNFVEIKNSEIGDGSKISHLSYIGDARFGKKVNVGCGLAVANYDGKDKHETTVGDGAFIGCHNALVAPVTLGPGCYTAAGSVITEDVPAGALAIARARQTNKEGRGVEAERLIQGDISNKPE